MPPALSINKESHRNSDHGIKINTLDCTKTQQGMQADPKAKVYIQPQNIFQKPTTSHGLHALKLGTIAQ